MMTWHGDMTWQQDGHIDEYDSGLIFIKTTTVSIFFTGLSKSGDSKYLPLDMMFSRSANSKYKPKKTSIFVNFRDKAEFGKW